MRISDWSSDVCSSDLSRANVLKIVRPLCETIGCLQRRGAGVDVANALHLDGARVRKRKIFGRRDPLAVLADGIYAAAARDDVGVIRSEEHTSELQSLMRISYAVFCLKKKKQRRK